MSKILTDIYSIIVLKEKALTAHPILPKSDYKGILNSIQNIVLCEEILINSGDARLSHVIPFCDELEGVFSYVDLEQDLIGGKHRSFPTSQDAIDGFLARADLYLRFTVLGRRIRIVLDRWRRPVAIVRFRRLGE